jgi:prepilin-type N-terminal cleavage/methylation domain-containing protein
MRNNVNKAFSLIELSIVLLIIGIIIAGVTQSSGLLAKAKLQSAQSATRSSPVAGIPDLLMWFETTLDESFAMADGTVQNEDGAIVNVWNDINPQSSSKFYMQSEQWYADAPTIYSKSSGTNGLPSIYFDNSDWSELILTNDANSSSPWLGIDSATVTIFTVHSFLTGGEFLIRNLYAQNGSNRISYYNSALGESYLLNTTNSIDASTSSIEITTLTLGSDANLYINGSNKINSSYSRGNERATIFDLLGSDIYVSELIVFDRILTNEERQTVEQYLGNKYGVSVAKENAP